MIRVFDNQNDFLEKYERFFSNDEICYGLIWGIAKRKSIVTYMISSEIDDRFVVGVLAGKNLIIASNTLEEDVYRDLVVYMNDVDYPGIIGLKEHCNLYNSLYSRVNGKNLITKMDQRIYYCTEINECSEQTGIVRLAEKLDMDCIVEWAINFSKEAEDSTTTLKDARKNIENKIMNRTLYVLEVNNQVVSMAARTRSLNTTESVGYVYTPENLRGKGYASRVVEEVTRLVLNDNKTATLYTDLSNPTSNSIYMKIGYKPYCDSVMMSN